MGYTEIQNYVPSNKYNIKCPYVMTPIGVTVHNTYNDATARNESNYMKNNDNSTSFHDVVDDKEVVHCIPHNRNAFHAGDGKNGTGNRKTIGVEICYSLSGGSKFDQAEQNAAKYIASILKAHNWTIKNVYKHQNWSGKYCPHRTMDYGWERFLNMIQSELNGGWVQDSVGWWYRNGDGSYPVNSWKLVDGQWYYFNEKGYMVTGWKQINSTWYYLEESGKMHTGWLDLNGTWYYLNQDGVMLTNWQLIDGTWYYFNTEGVMQTDWQLIEGQWYYFDTNGKMFASKWINSKGKDYYLTASGAMATSCYVKSASANIYYWVNKDGVWEPEWNTSTPNLTKYKVVV